MKRVTFVLILLFALTGLAFGCGNGEEDNQEDNQVVNGDGEAGDGEAGDGEAGDGDGTPEDTIVDIASANADFSLLVDAVVRADLVDTLNGPGPFTVFAPTNAAFESYLEGTSIDDLDPEVLSGILNYHVLGANVLAEDIEFGAYTTANGALIIIGNGDGVTFGNANVTSTDIVASNGVIHVIDAVVTPPGNAVEVATGAGFETLVAAAVAAGLGETLTTGGPFTIFAPNEEAFAAAGIDLETIEQEVLAAVLQYHVLDGAVTSYDVAAGDVITLNGAAATIAADGGLTYAGANIIATDVVASNAIIHVIDEVVFPPSDD